MGNVFEVKTICYKREREWESRADAISFFKDCVVNSDGSEQSRYITIVQQLMAGAVVSSDLVY